jgi:hypothetical protein
MRTTFYILLLILTTIVFSCEKNGLLVLCRDCYVDEPERPTIEVKLSNFDPAMGFYVVQVDVYDGNLEDSILIVSDKVTSGDWSYKGYFNKKYTFTATYVLANNKYITVDAAFPEVRYVKDQCDEPCYYVYGNKINLRLKYPKF